MSSVDLSTQKINNLKFFQKYAPEVYKTLNDYTPVKKLFLDPAQGIVDVINEETKQTLYEGNAVDYAAKEVNDYLEQVQPLNNVLTSPPLLKLSEANERFQIQAIKQCLSSAPYETEHGRFTGYNFHSEAPLLVVVGCGLGYHINELLNKQEINHLIVFEPDIDMLYASLFTMDWQSLFNYFAGDESKRIDMIFDFTNHRGHQYSSLWNKLIQYPPFFPYGTIFYNHRRLRRHETVIKKVRDDMTTYFNLWGTYDDEVNQFNNARHNFLEKVKCLSSVDKNVCRDVPVFILGSGPSIDQRIDWIKANADKAIIVSSGSARDICKANGIIPDIQIELESDYIVADVYNRGDYSDFYEKSLLVGAIQCTPWIFKYFKKSVAYFKESTALTELFNKDNLVNGTTPSSLNAGLAICHFLGFRKLFLFGADFSYIDREQHHSKSSLYYKDNMKDVTENYEKLFNSLKMVEGVDGVEKETMPFLYTCQRRAEVEIARARNHFPGILHFNCSLGAKIEGTVWISKAEEMEKLFASFPAVEKEPLLKQVEESTFTVPMETLKEKTEFIQQTITDICENITVMVKEMQSDTRADALQVLRKISNYLEYDVSKRLGTIYYFFRGTTWFWLAGYYSQIHSCKPGTEEQLIQHWNKAFIKFLAEWPEHFEHVVSREKNYEDDPLINSVIRKPIYLEEFERWA